MTKTARYGVYYPTLHEWDTGEFRTPEAAILHADRRATCFSVHKIDRFRPENVSHSDAEYLRCPVSTANARSRVTTGSGKHTARQAGSEVSMGSVELMVIDINWQDPQDPNGVVNCMRKICATSDFVADCVEATDEETIAKIMQSSLRHFREGSDVELISAQIMYRGTEPVVFHSHGITCPKKPEHEMLKFAYMTPEGEQVIPWGLHGAIGHCGKHGDG